MKRLILIANDPSLSFRHSTRIMKMFNLMLIILLVECLFQAGKVHADELPVTVDPVGEKPLNMICKSIGSIGFTGVDGSEEYRPANFKTHSYVVVENKRELKMWKESPGSEDILKVLNFKSIGEGKGMVLTCKDMFPSGNNASYECISYINHRLILNKNNLRYTITYSDGWVISNNSVYVEYGICSRVE